ncbi:MarR family winged helix-turn-helix transcriptional regulator [Bordetella sp. BOR01]|uniref:MarR family winged helix-turn-helix transcriptional regulator n=1 Tax=Bordetella sp. BOR01 TaxID=2854779 RepID=UPI001C46C625|nr:MarR family transcriptional regulator [Bordetella sp. BOR01]MBV7484674.1 MarR family transcriptional regulator [Bordetella sp. BOR01]
MIFLTYRLEALSEEAIKLVNEHYVRSCGLSVRELRVLRCIDDHPAITPGGIVAFTYLEKSLVSRILNLLIKQGLVRRSVSPSDARQFNLVVTAKGHKLRAHADEVGKTLEDVMLAPLDAAERRALSDVLEKMTRWVTGEGMSAELAARFHTKG